MIRPVLINEMPFQKSEKTSLCVKQVFTKPSWVCLAEHLSGCVAYCPLFHLLDLPKAPNLEL